MPAINPISGVPRRPAAPNDRAAQFFLNRDQIVFVNREHDGIAITTVFGLKVRMSGPPQDLAVFSDELLNAIGSNFVSVPPLVGFRIVASAAAP